MGGLGQLFATYLASEYNAKLILIGRSKRNQKHEIIIQKLIKMDENARHFLHIASLSLGAMVGLNLAEYSLTRNHMSVKDFGLFTGLVTLSSLGIMYLSRR